MLVNRLEVVRESLMIELRGLRDMSRTECEEEYKHLFEPIDEAIEALGSQDD